MTVQTNALVQCCVCDRFATLFECYVDAGGVIWNIHAIVCAELVGDPNER